MARIELLNSGGGNYVLAAQVVAILASNTAPIRRAIRLAKATGSLLDVSQQRVLQSLVVLDDGQVIGTHLASPVLVRRFENPASTVDAQDGD